MYTKYPILVAVFAMLILVTAITSTSCAPAPGSPAPEYSKDLGQMGVTSLAGNAMHGKTLSDLSVNRRMLLYFWSAAVKECDAELSVLERFRSDHPEYKVLTVAFPVYGDEENKASRSMAKRHPTIDTLLDVNRSLYSVYCPRDKSETRSAFRIDPYGTVEKTRTGQERNGDLAKWLEYDGSEPPPTSSTITINPSVPVPPDVRDHPLETEILRALDLGYMSLPDGTNFRPEGTIRAADFMACLAKVLGKVGIAPEELARPDKPTQPITREQVAKLVVSSLYSPEKIAYIGKAVGGPTVYLNDFIDARDVSRWAEPCVAAAVYRGWFPDRYRLDPKKNATRAYIAALLVRAFAHPDTSTGLIVRLKPEAMRRSQGLQIVCDLASGPCDVIYPCDQNLPSLAFVNAPGLVSWCKTDEDAKQYRVGPNPIVVDALEARKPKGAKCQLVLSSTDAEKVRNADKMGLFLRSWRVAVVMPDASPEEDAEESEVSSDLAGPDPRPIQHVRTPTLLLPVPQMRAVKLASFSSNGSMTIATSNNDLRVWSPTSGRHVQYTPMAVSGSTAANWLAISPDNKLVAELAEDGSVVVRETGEWRVLDVLRNPKFPTHPSPDTNEDPKDDEPHSTAAAFSADGKTLAVAQGWSTALWATAEWQYSLSFEGGQRVALNWDGSRLAAVGQDQRITIWDTRTGKEVRKLEYIPGKALSILFGHDNTVLVASAGGRVSEWSLDDMPAQPKSVLLAGDSDGIVAATLSAEPTVLATCHTDGRLKMWDAESGAELATMVALDRGDWIILNPDGRFDATNRGMELAQYQVGDERLPVGAFFRKYYTPGLFARLQAGERLPQFGGADIRAGIALPPAVKLVSPRSGLATNQRTLSVTLQAEDRGGGVAEIRLYQNGKLVAARSQKSARGPRDPALKESVDVYLIPGANYFRATGIGEDGTESNGYTFTVTSKTDEPTCILYVLAVGISKYKNERFNLQFAHSDAEAFAQTIEKHSQTIFEHIEVERIFDQDATAENVRTRLSTISSKCKPEDVFVLYYSGHGLMGPAEDGGTEDYYLAMADVTGMQGTQGLSNSGLSSKELLKLCQEVKAQKIALLFDSCDSGALAFVLSGGLSVPAARGFAEEKAIAQLARSAGVAVLAACLKGQTAKEIPDLKSGTFTYAVLEALKGENGVAGMDGKVTVTETKAYVEDRVCELTQKHAQSDQVPAGYVSGQDFPLTVVGAKH